MTKKILKEHANPDKSKESAEIPGKSSAKSTTAAKDNNVEGKPQVRKRKAATAFGANSPALHRCDMSDVNQCSCKVNVSRT